MEVYFYKEEDKEKVLELDIGEIEKLELIHSTGLTPKEALIESLEASLATWYAVEDGVVVGVGGVTLHPTEEGMGVPWMLSTGTFVRDNLFTVNSLTYDLIEYCFENLGMYVLCNFVWLHNAQSIKWLKAIGFDFMSTLTWKNGEPFEQFYLYKEDYYV